MIAKLQELPNYAIQACKLLSNKENNQEENMLIEQLKKRAVNEDYVSSDEESDFKSYTLVIVSTMTEHEKIYQTWQNNEANLARQKRIMLD